MGLLLHIVILYVYAVSGLVAPGWGLAVLLVFWVAMLVLALRVWVSRPVLVAFIPAIDTVFWYALVTAGATWWGWTG
jgi:hypothetical protein